MPALHRIVGHTDPLREDLERGADRIAAAVPIARAIIDGKQAMAKINMPNLAGVAGAFDKYRYGVETRAQKLIERVTVEAEAHADAVFKRAHARLNEHIDAVGDIEAQIEGMDKALGNGAPEGLPPSSGDSGGDQGTDHSGPFGK